MRNLAPNLCRQRLIVEATTSNFVDNPVQIAEYLEKLTKVVGMTPCSKPFVYTAHEDGWGAWQHWKTSGASFYTYPARGGDSNLITLDCYTCKPFDPKLVVEFTKKFFDVIDIVWNEV